MEGKFNRKFKYPWVLLNEVPFTDEFKRRVRVLTDAPVSFGVIPREHWFQPDWIDETLALEGRKSLVMQNTIYGVCSISYRNMCRFNSGFFFRHELLQPYKWYWRVEPDVRYFCDLNYDPFLYMEDNNKLYGFTISMTELEPTIPTLWSSVKEFIAENPQYLHRDNSMDFLSDDGDTYNLCHFWSNFEIGDMDFWRSEAYMKFFEFLDEKGGFYYERWGDAPIHSIALSLFAGGDQIHFFKDIGYRHGRFQHCPQGKTWREGHCSCDPDDVFDFTPGSCLSHFLGMK
ncbi:glycosyltransferase family 15 protein [Gyrodon lividus]|nr:glycosyltransferase family 15 protein [Gyrodon lividus]